MTNVRTLRKFRSSEYLEGLFQVVEDLALDDSERRELADRYQRARMLSGKTQRQLADDIGYTERTIGSYERGEPDQPLRVVQQWAKATGVRAEWLMTGEGDPFREGRPVAVEAALADVTEALARIEERLAALEGQLAAPPRTVRRR